MTWDVIQHEDGKSYLQFDQIGIVTPRTPDQFVEVHYLYAGKLVLNQRVGKPVYPGETIFVKGIEGRMQFALELA